MAERGAAVRAATAELETLLYSVSHDLRAPLRHLIGFSRLLLDECRPDLDPAALHYAQRITMRRPITWRRWSMIWSALPDRTPGRARGVRFGLTPLVEDVVGQLRTVNGRRIEWHIEELPAVQADPVSAKIALTQLLSNAVKFTRPRERAAIRIAPAAADGLAGLSVQDNGVGFRMAHAGKLFGLFQRLHRPDEFEGNGAGLAIVQRIAHKHGGRVWAESEPDAGATFYLTLGSREDGTERPADDGVSGIGNPKEGEAGSRGPERAESATRTRGDGTKREAETRGK